MYCYRRRGHNEGDEPAFTQPLLYKAIDDRQTVREVYLEQLLHLGEITGEEADRIEQDRRERLEKAISLAPSRGYVPPPRGPGGRLGGLLGRS